MINTLCKMSWIIWFCVICIYKGIPLNQTDHYALPNICGLSEVGLPSTTALISEISGADAALNHEQDRQISDPVSAIMGNGCLPKTTILEMRENNALRFSSSLSLSSHLCYGFLALPMEPQSAKRNVGTQPYNRYMQLK